MKLYRQQILNHFKKPRNFGKLKDADIVIEENNASCGDKIEISMRLQKSKVKSQKSRTIDDLKFKGVGCAISIAAASMLTEFVKGKKVVEIEKLKKDDIFKLLGVKVGPGRIRCATLALEAIKKGVKVYEEKNK